jgi:hypothetical protein
MLLAPMSERQKGAWLGLLEVTPLLPERSWCIAGGQMVFLYCCERQVPVNRPSDDGDVVLDVRAQPEILLNFTSALTKIGFESAGVSPDGHQHRWVRGGSQIDVLIPRHLGQRADKRTGASGGTTISTPGAQQALDRSEAVDIEFTDVQGRVYRPSMIGALVAKAAAFSVQDPDKLRHVIDFAVLASMIEGSDRIAEQLRKRDRDYLVPMVEALDKNRTLWVAINDNVERGVELIRDLTR